MTTQLTTVNILYHGTSEVNAVSIRKVGLRGTHIWLARWAKDAATVGGEIVFAVNMEGLGEPDWYDSEKSDWQRCYHGGFIGLERLTEMGIRS